MTEVLSRDGTTIAFDRIGSGTPIVLVDGALSDRSSGPNGALAQVLSEHFHRVHLRSARTRRER